MKNNKKDPLGKMKPYKVKPLRVLKKVKCRVCGMVHEGYFKRNIRSINSVECGCANSIYDQED